MTVRTLAGLTALIAAAPMAPGLISSALAAPAAPISGFASYRPAYGDARIHTLPYDPDAVVRLNAVFGYQMMIRFAPDERIENVAIGEGASWQVTPNKDATLLFIKPVDHAQRTNMTVVTDRRSYLFELDAEAAGAVRPDQITYVVRFTYPPEPVVAQARPEAPPAPPERRNVAYTYTGSRALLPSVVFDDGRFTYFRWPENTATPALFLVSPDGSESLVNYSYHDGFQVVEQIAPSFRLRDGKEVTTVINDGWRAPRPGDEAPRPHDAKTAREAAKQDKGR